MLRNGIGTAFLFILISWTNIFAQSPEIEKALDDILTAVYKADEPGATVLVSVEGKVIYRKAFGLANVELNVPMKPEHKLRIGSMTKQFTAVAILMLAQEGTLALSDSITKFLPDFPTQGKTVTIEHLLTHTSGIKSYTNMREWLRNWRKDMTVRELIDFFKNEPREFEPGTKWSYNNSGYVLLGAIIQAVSGESYGAFLKRRIFDPLGMSNTMIDETEKIIPGRAAGYDKGTDVFTNAAYLSMTQPYAAGALLSTVDDLAKWDAALYSELLLRQATLQRAWTPYKLANGKSTGYGYGWMVGTLLGRPVLEHGGGIHGFRSDGIRLPDEKIYVVVLTNNPPSNPGAVAAKLAAIVLGTPLKEPTAISLSETVLEKFTGVYVGDDGLERFVTREGTSLFLQQAGGTKNEIFPLSDLEFFSKKSLTRYRFERDAQGTIQSLRVVRFPDVGPADRAQRSEKPAPKPRTEVNVPESLLKDYVGTYELAPSFIITISFENGKLMAQATGQPKLQIFPESQSKFFYKVVDAQIEFPRDADGVVRRLVLTQGGQTLPAQKR